MIGAGVIALVAGLLLVHQRFASASGVDKILVSGPVFEAVSLAMFAAEHFTAAHDLMVIVPHWLPGPLFWTYFVGAALLAAAISFIAWRYVRWSASLLALLFLIIVITVDLPSLPKELHQRLFWTLTVREIAFASGALVLAGSLWPRRKPTGAALITVGRTVLACIFVFYAIEHFLFPLFVPGVPLDKLTPAWIPAPRLISYLIGTTLLVTGIGLLLQRTRRLASAIAGTVLLLLTIFFYIPIFITEIHTPLAIDGLNYTGDTLLFAATAFLAGFSIGETLSVASLTGNSASISILMSREFPFARKSLQPIQKQWNNPKPKSFSLWTFVFWLLRSKIGSRSARNYCTVCFPFSRFP
jgi:uncharacterized membrane protein